jgi:hypothetical protein
MDGNVPGLSGDEKQNIKDHDQARTGLRPHSECRMLLAIAFGHAPMGWARGGIDLTSNRPILIRPRQ